MSTDTLVRARKELKELSRMITAAGRRYDLLNEFIARETQKIASGEAQPRNQIGLFPRSGAGAKLRLIENLTSALLMEFGRPMEGAEKLRTLVERGAVAKLGKRTLANVLCRAKARGVFVHIPKLGYWLPGEEFASDAGVESARIRRARIRTRKRIQDEAEAVKIKRGRGRPRLITNEQLEKAEHWLRTGSKRKCDIARELGIEAPVLYYYFRKYLKISVPEDEILVHGGAGLEGEQSAV